MKHKVKRLAILKLWSLEERRNRTDLLDSFKIYKGMSIIKLSDTIEIPHNKSTRGHHMKLMIHRSRTDLRKYFFSERVAKRWNELGEDDIDAGCINTFKSRLSKLREKRTGFFMDKS